MFREGDDVEVWNKHRDCWMQGRVLGVAKESKSSEGPNNAQSVVKVKLKSDEKVISEELVQLRHCIPWETPAIDSQVPPLGVFRALRERFFKTTGHNIKPGGKHEFRISMSVLETMWLKSAEDDAHRTSSTQQERENVHQKVKTSYQALNVRWFLGSDDTQGSVDVYEWLHRMLMLLHPAGPDAEREIEKELAIAGPKTLPNIVGRWMRIDKTGSGLICKDALAEAFQDEFWPRLSIRLATKMAAGMLRDMDINGLGKCSYTEYVIRCLGLKCNEVVLYYYDLSNDWAKYLSPLLLGSWEGGLWHTGIAVYGREYFFGGRICYGAPGATVWGRPTRALRLGLTTRSLDELRQHIFMDLDRKYHSKSYDVLDRNCNHFADEAAGFLLGRGIPDEVRLQPQRLMSAPVTRMLRPLLNRWLGKAEQGKPADEAASERASEKTPPPARKPRVSAGGA